MAPSSFGRFAVEWFLEVTWTVLCGNGVGSVRDDRVRLVPNIRWLNQSPDNGAADQSQLTNYPVPLSFGGFLFLGSSTEEKRLFFPSLSAIDDEEGGPWNLARIWHYGNFKSLGTIFFSEEKMKLCIIASSWQRLRVSSNSYVI